MEESVQSESAITEHLAELNAAYQEQSNITEQNAHNRALRRFAEVRSWFTANEIAVWCDRKTWRLATPEEVAVLRCDSMHSGQMMHLPGETWNIKRS